MITTLREQLSVKDKQLAAQAAQLTQLTTLVGRLGQVCGMSTTHDPTPTPGTRPHLTVVPPTGPALDTTPWLTGAAPRSAKPVSWSVRRPPLVRLCAGEPLLLSDDEVDLVDLINRAVRDTAQRHPQVAPLITRFPPRTVDAMAYVEAGFRSYLRAGFEPKSIARCYRALAVYSVGSIEVEPRNHYFRRSPASRDNEPTTVDEPTLERHLPGIAAVGPQLSDQDDADEFEYGLELLISGLAHLPRSAPNQEA